MNTAASTGASFTIRALWKRAPIWRFFVLLAPTLTAIVLLFPPGTGDSTQRKAASDDQASFLPTGADGASVASTSAASQAATQASSSVAPPSAQTNPEQVAHAAPPADSAIPARPKTAQLSMATAGQVPSPNDTGLNAAAMGPLYSNTITSTGFTLPLPPGKWAVLALTSVKTPTASGMAYYLGRIEHKRLIGAVKFFALRNTAAPSQGFPEAKACTQPNPFRSYVFIDHDIVPSDHQACWLVENYYSASFQYWADRGVKLGALERAAGGDLTAKGVSYPQDLVNVRFTRSDKSGFLEANYLFSPETAGISSHQSPSAYDSDWASANVKRFPDKMAYLAKLKTWGDSFWSRFTDAFTQGVASRAP